MALTWGPIISNSVAGQVRVGLDPRSMAYVPAGPLSPSTTGVTYTWDVYMQSRGALQDTVNVSLSGSALPSTYTATPTFSDTTINSGITGAAPKLIGSTRQTIPLTYSAATRTATLTVSGIYGSSSSATHTVSLSVPARPYAAPAAPSGVQVARVSDTRHTINWTRNNPGSASAPYQNMVIQRSADNATAWTTVATVGNVSSWTDTTTVPGRRYQYRVAAKNSGGTSAYAVSPTIYTTPAAPTAVRAVRQGTDVLVTWTKSISPHSRSRLAWRQEGGPWQYPAWTSTGTSYVITSPDPSLPLQYAVQAEVDTQGTTLGSTYTWSAWVQLLAAPAAPTDLAPALADAAQPITLSWRHTSTDSSEQSAREIRWRPLGAVEWNGIPKASATGTTHVVPAGLWEPGTVEWQVRTWGAHADPSPWSALALTRVAQAPSVTITSPQAGPLGASQAQVIYDFFDPEGEAQAAGSVQIIDDAGSLIYQRTWEHSSRGLTAPVRLDDGRTYTVRVRARAASGLWSAWDQVVVDVAYPHPPIGVLTAEWLPDSASVMLTVAVPPAGEGEAPATSTQVWRSVDGAPWALFAADLPTDTALVDRSPHTSAVTAYRLVTVSDLPSTAEAAPVLVSPDPQGWIWLSAGPDWSQTVRMRDNARLGMKWSRAAERHHLAGTSLPISIRGEQTTHVLDVAVRLAPNPDGGASWAELRDFLRQAEEPILYRDAKGHRLFVSIPEVSGSAERILEEASFTVYEIDHVEAEAVPQ